MEAQLQEQIRDAYDRREPVVIQGGNTKAAMLRPVQAARTISLADHTGVTLYAPKELVFAARAGTTMADVEARLAASGQHMIAEPPDYSRLLGATGQQTLGGVVSANLSGPRRIAWGAVRDHVLGVRAINGTGELIRSGGRVLKNVTGLDLCKLLTGAHGTLAVLSEITLKVLPAPADTASIAVRGLDACAGVAVLSAALGSAFGVSGAAYLPPACAARLGESGSLALMRIEESAHSVAYRGERLRAAFAAEGHAVDIWPAPQSLAAWRAIRDADVLEAAPTDAVWRVSVRPSRGPSVLDAVERAGGTGFLDWGGGLAVVAGPAREQMHAAVTQAAREAGGVWMLLRAPAPWRAAVAGRGACRDAGALRDFAARQGGVRPGGDFKPGPDVRRGLAAARAKTGLLSRVGGAVPAPPNPPSIMGLALIIDGGFGGDGTSPPSLLHGRRQIGQHGVHAGDLAWMAPLPIGQLPTLQRLVAGQPVEREAPAKSLTARVQPRHHQIGQRRLEMHGLVEPTQFGSKIARGRNSFRRVGRDAAEIPNRDAGLPTGGLHKITPPLRHRVLQTKRRQGLHQVGMIGQHHDGQRDVRGARQRDNPRNALAIDPVGRAPIVQLPELDPLLIGK